MDNNAKDSGSHIQKYYNRIWISLNMLIISIVILRPLANNENISLNAFFIVMICMNFILSIIKIFCVTAYGYDYNSDKKDEENPNDRSEVIYTMRKQIFGARFKELRLKNTWPLAEVAKILGLKSKGSISAFEAGRSVPSVDVLIKVAEIFNVSTDYLLGMDEVDIVDLQPEILVTDIIQENRRLKAELSELRHRLFVKYIIWVGFIELKNDQIIERGYLKWNMKM